MGLMNITGYLLSPFSLFFLLKALGLNVVFQDSAHYGCAIFFKACTFRGTWNCENNP
jgi:hypothetical protein